MRSSSPLNFITGVQGKEKNIIDSDLVFSPAQVTKHCHDKLKDQEISQGTKDRFEKLKQQYPEVFSLSNQATGHTNLVTMQVDMGDSPPICQKPCTLPLKHYSWVQQENETLEMQESSKKSSALGPALSSWYPRSLHMVNPQDVECVWISEKSMNSSQKHKG